MLFYYLLLVDAPSIDNTEEHPSSDTDDKTPPSSGLLLVNVPSTDNTEEHPSSNTDDKTPSSSGHS